MAKIMNLGEVVDRNAFGDEIFLIEVAPDGSSRNLTYSQMHRDADALARGLTRRALKRGERIGILAGNSAEYLIAYIGIMRAGLVPVPINFKLPRDTIDYIIGDSKIVLMLVDEARAGFVCSIPSVRMDEYAAWKDLLDPGEVAPLQMQDGEFATILYTSGSTGRPKGVPLTHGGYVWVVDVLTAAAPPFKGSRALVAAPLYHMNALIQSLLIGVAGGTVVMLRQFSARAYLEAAAGFRCEMVTAVPTMFALAARETDLLETLDLSHVQSAKSGSAPATDALFDRLAKMFPNAPVTNWWGTTESGPVAFGAHPDGVARPKLALGYPLPDTELKLVDGPNGNEGVLWVRSKAITPGYLNLPAETAKKFKDGWYNTGDVMIRDADGFYYFVGRADDMFVCGGENVYPGEVEMLLERHPGVAQAVVLPVADEIKGQIPVAFIVRRPGAECDVDALKKFAIEHGPAYQHPRFVEFVTEMPLAGTNKIDRRVLAERAAKSFVR